MIRPVAYTVLLAVGLPVLNAARFQPCGKRPGIVTTTKSAALTTKILNDYGVKLIMDYPLTSKQLLQALDIYCGLLQLCYTYNEEKKPKPGLFRRAIKDCMGNSTLAFSKSREDVFGEVPGGMESFLLAAKACVRDGNVPLDAVTATAMIRYVRSFLMKTSS